MLFARLLVSKTRVMMVSRGACVVISFSRIASIKVWEPSMIGYSSGRRCGWRLISSRSGADSLRAGSFISLTTSASLVSLMSILRTRLRGRQRVFWRATVAGSWLR